MTFTATHVRASACLIHLLLCHPSITINVITAIRHRRGVRRGVRVGRWKGLSNRVCYLWISFFFGGGDTSVAYQRCWVPDTNAPASAMGFCSKLVYLLAAYLFACGLFICL